MTKKDDEKNKFHFLKKIGKQRCLEKFKYKISQIKNIVNKLF